MKAWARSTISGFIPPLSCFNLALKCWDFIPFFQPATRESSCTTNTKPQPLISLLKYLKLIYALFLFILLFSFNIQNWQIVGKMLIRKYLAQLYIYLSKFWSQIPGNKMTSLNLATIFGPNLLHKQKNSDKEFSVQSSARAEESTAVIAVLQRMIASYQKLFVVSDSV